MDILKENDLLSEGAVYSLLTDLDNLGVFKKINGLIIGRPADFSKEETSRLKEKILGFLGDKKCPILLYANIGHTDPIATIRYGRKIRLDSSRNVITVI